MRVGRKDGRPSLVFARISRSKNTCQKSIGLRGCIFLILAVLLAGCTASLSDSVYRYIGRQGYDAVTDERPLGQQADDARISGTIKGDLLASGVEGITMSVFCRNGIVVLAGVVEHGSKAGKEAVSIARQIHGVRKVETYFLPSQSLMRDFMIKVGLYFEMALDSDLKADEVDVAVIDGHVVLVAVVSSRAKAERIVAMARVTRGVKAVKSFIQVAR